MLTVGDKFPSFNLVAVKGGLEGLKGPDNSFTNISNNSDIGKWKIIFFWPKDFTFVCPSEVVDFNRLYNDFISRNAVIYGISTDSEYAHLNWRLHDEELVNISIPLLSDSNRVLTETLGILDNKAGAASRATFIVDPDDIIQWITVNPLNIGRNPEEVLRVLDALLTGELCPSSWNKGDSTLNPQDVFDHAISLLDRTIENLSVNK
jgi:peroxiredoxin (alkyl hydroperoxide reductase subunit C)